MEHCEENWRETPVCEKEHPDNEVGRDIDEIIVPRAQ